MGSYYTGGEGLNAVRVCTGTLWGSYYTGGGRVLLQLGNRMCENISTVY